MVVVARAVAEATVTNVRKKTPCMKSDVSLAVSSNPVIMVENMDWSQFVNGAYLDYEKGEADDTWFSWYNNSLYWLCVQLPMIVTYLVPQYFGY